MLRNKAGADTGLLDDIAWGSDLAAVMLRDLGVEYVALNPGASYRGLHDSLVNLLGDRAPSMLLCLHEDHVVSIAHGYAKVKDHAMGAILHSNVGLMHGLMGVFNAWCDRAPMLVLGATGPVDARLRRPWIDWIHTAKDQGALLRDYVKWDDEPRSPEALVEAMMRAHLLTNTEPRAPVYICLDAGLQEQKLDRPVSIDVSRHPLPPRQVPDAQSVMRIAALIRAAERPLFLFGRGSRDQADWNRRVALAEAAGARVLTSIRERSVFPTAHPLHIGGPFFWASEREKQALREADLIVSFDWVDLKGLLMQADRNVEALPAKLVHVSLDSHLHRGWSMDYFGLAPVDVPVQANADALVAALLAELPGTDATEFSPNPPSAYVASPGEEIAPQDIEIALQKLRGSRALTLAHVTIGWSGQVYDFAGPLDFLGGDGGAGLAAGPGLTIGAALALKGQGRIVVGVLGDGDFLQGATALWTAARYQIPALFIVSNNRSNYNDEMHQEAVAKIRSRPVENKAVGQAINDPEISLTDIARAQGVEAIGPVTNHAELEAAILAGFDAVAAGRPCFIDVRVAAGYATTPLSRG
jgi:thiamine pyrophosphate-dependent acetolactate synthase large subunit-like protein